MVDVLIQLLGPIVLLNSVCITFFVLYFIFYNLVFVLYLKFFFSDTYIQKAKKVFLDGRSRRNMNALNSQLQDVQRIMVQNIDDVLQRGTVLSGNNIVYVYIF